jgi:acyl-CoA thioesterase-1
MRSRFFGFLTQLLITWVTFILIALVAITAQAAQNIVIFGDSLSAAYGIQSNKGWVALLESKLKQQNSEYKVINASISGETTRGGLTRFDQMLKTHQPEIVLIELGANDGLRGLSLNEMQSNLNNMIAKAKAKNAIVMLLGIKIPPNYGIQYTQKFSAIYATLAQKYNLNLVPFFLDGVAGNRKLIQDDGLHPNAVAQAKLLENIWPKLEELLKK